jgi:hypothetical protein
MDGFHLWVLVDEQFSKQFEPKDYLCGSVQRQPKARQKALSYACQS